MQNFPKLWCTSQTEFSRWYELCRLWKPFGIRIYCTLTFTWDDYAFKAFAQYIQCGMICVTNSAILFIIQGPPNSFFLENGLKKTTELFLKFFFYLKVQYFRLIMENNFIQMAASAGHAVAYTIVPILKHIIDCVQLYFTNGFTNVVL